MSGNLVENELSSFLILKKNGRLPFKKLVFAGVNVASNNILVPAEDPEGEQRKFPYLDGIEDNMQVCLLLRCFSWCCMLCVFLWYDERVRHRGGCI